MYVIFPDIDVKALPRTGEGLWIKVENVAIRIHLTQDGYVSVEGFLEDGSVEELEGLGGVLLCPGHG